MRRIGTWAEHQGSVFHIAFGGLHEQRVGQSTANHGVDRWNICQQPAHICADPITLEFGQCILQCGLQFQKRRRAQGIGPAARN